MKETQAKLLEAEAALVRGHSAYTDSSIQTDTTYTMAEEDKTLPPVGELRKEYLRSKNKRQQICDCLSTFERTTQVEKPQLLAKLKTKDKMKARLRRPDEAQKEVGMTTSRFEISYPRNASMPYANALRCIIFNLLLCNPISNPTGVFSRGW